MKPSMPKPTPRRSACRPRTSAAPIAPSSPGKNRSSPAIEARIGADASAHPRLASVTEHRPAIVKNQAHRGIHADEPEENPWAVGTPDVDQVLVAAVQTLPSHVEEGEPIHRGAIHHLIEEAQRNDADDIGRQEMIGKAQMQQQARNQRPVAVTDIQIEAQRALVGIGAVEQRIRRPDVAPVICRKQIGESHLGEDEVQHRTILVRGKTPAIIRILLLDEVDAQIQHPLPQTDEHVQRQKENHQQIDDAEATQQLVMIPRSCAKNRNQKYADECKKVHDASYGIEICGLMENRIMLDAAARQTAVTR
ncbi:protein of unknown function [Sterolibacterium denitrificans]|uniref:Uncharacterized protein n=1 Tax=Sterolibacterium denitrificans TaxID=157592 RepID=A0A7Z7HSA8_9PROT|nr:protein of unknown function [Sterolibacterium denitrificans]